MDDLFNKAMSLHSQFCDRQDKDHPCVGTATISRGEIKLECQLCGKGNCSKWEAKHVAVAEKILNSAGVCFWSLNIESQVAVLREIRDAY